MTIGKKPMNKISIKKWVRRGKMLLNTEALDWDDPDHPYNQAKAQGVVPEDFGLRHSLYEKFDQYTRSELIDMILKKEKEINVQDC